MLLPRQKNASAAPIYCHTLRIFTLITVCLLSLTAHTQEKLAPNLRTELSTKPYTPPDPAEKIIYGTDDRIDVFNETDPNRIALSASVCALISNSRLTDNGNGTFTITLSAYNIQGLPPCPGEAFATQSTAAFCSGFIVANDIVVTAGHCIGGPSDLSKFSFVFGFDMINAITPTTIVNADQVYSGIDLMSWAPGGDDDHALVQVDRNITAFGVNPLALGTGSPNALDPVGVIGHPSGLQKKIAFGIQTGVIDNSPAGYFTANLDAYGGNAGSPVFNRTTLVVEGILVRGPTDFFDGGGCFSSIQEPDVQGAAESTRISAILPCLDDGNCSNGGDITCNASLPLSGALSPASPHYDRITSSGGIDPGCNAPSNDSIFDNMPFAAFPVTTPTLENFQAQVTAANTTVTDTVLSLYCDPFDPGNPANNLIAFNDDFNGNLLSGFDAQENILLQPDTRYWLVLSTFDGADLDGGVFDICLGGDFVEEGQSPIDDGLIHSSIPPPFIEEGNFLVLSRASGSGHQWMLNGVPLVDAPPRLFGVNSRDLTFSPVLQSDAGTYTVQYDDGNKAIIVAPPFSMTVLPPNSLPASNLLVLGLLAGAFTIFGLREVRKARR